MQWRKSRVKRSEMHTVWRAGGGKLSGSSLWGGVWEENWMKRGQKPSKNLGQDHSRQRKTTPEVKYKFGMFREQQAGQCKESRTSSGRKRYWSIGLLRDLISHTLFSHRTSLDFTTPVRRSHWKVLREESYFSVSSRCSGQERGKNGSTSEEAPHYSR